jgi:hypothetical protein
LDYLDRNPVVRDGSPQPCQELVLVGIRQQPGLGALPEALMPIVEGAHVTGPLRLDADVCVVGTGAGGAVVAAILAEAGARVVVLEKGGFYTAADFSQREDDMMTRIEGGNGFTASVDGTTSFTYGECVGGSTVH